MILTGGIISKNHNDLYQILSQDSSMIKILNLCGIYTDNSVQNADKEFDYKSLRKKLSSKKKDDPKHQRKHPKQKED